MKCAFVSNGNESFVSPTPQPVRDLEWFKMQLRAVGVGELQIVWNAEEHFFCVPSEYLERYICYRKTCSHRGALARIQEEFAALEA